MALSSVVDWRRAAGARSASRRYYERCQSARSCVDAVRECSRERNYVSWGRDNGVVREAGTVVFREFSRVLSRGLELEAVLHSQAGYCYRIELRLRLNLNPHP